MTDAETGTATSDPPAANATVTADVQPALEPTGPPMQGDEASWSGCAVTDDPLLRRGEVRLLLIMVASIAVLCTAAWLRLSGWGGQPIEIGRLPSREYQFRVDVNSATWVEWTQLEGVGETMARNIVADREANGPFRSIDDLDRVKGIGKKTLERLRPWLECANVAEDDASR
jgi:competence protein ComEA